MMAARLLRHTPEEEQGRFFRRTGEMFDRIIARYDRALSWVLDHQPLTLVVFLITLALSAILYLAIPKGFFPLQDTGLIQGVSEAPQAVSFEAMSRRSRALAAAILEDPAVDSVSTFIGVDGTNITLNSGRLLIALKPHNARDHAPVVMARLKERLARREGMVLYMQPVQDLTIEDRVSRTQFQFTLEGADADELATWTRNMVDRLQQLPELAEVASDLQDQGLQAYVTIDRDTAGRLGVTPSAIDNALYNAFGQRLISTIFTQATQYRVVLEVKPEFRLGPAALDDIYVPATGTGGGATSTTGSAVTSGGSATNTGASGGATQVRLSAVAKGSERLGAPSIGHLGQFPATTGSFNLPPGQAIHKAALIRFRPILMTTMAAMLGALPLMISWGVGSELRHPLGIAMVGGLIFSQLLTIFTTPVIYLYFDRLAERWGKKTRPIEGGEPSPEPSPRGEGPNDRSGFAKVDAD